MVRLKLDSLGEVGNGAVEFRRLEMRGPPLEVGGGIIGVGFNRLGVRDGTLNLLLFVPIRPCLCLRTSKPKQALEDVSLGSLSANQSHGHDRQGVPVWPDRYH